MASIKVGVLRGGISDEHKVSLKTGESVLSNLPEKYSGHDIILTKSGEWYFRGWPAQPERIFRSLDVIFNALHGRYGEDGKVQQLLETFKIPYTGSGILASALGMNKILSRESFARSGLKIPLGDFATDNESSFESANRIIKKIPPPWIVKPASSGSSFGVIIARDFNALIKAIGDNLGLDSRVIIEEYIPGREATCGVLERFRGQEHYTLPIIEIIPPPDSDFFDYSAKYSGETQELCPANFDPEIKLVIEEMARKAHIALGCRHYSRADFIISPKGIYILEVNTLPGLTEHSLLPKAIKAVGSSYAELLDHLITLALNK
ncbi:MAG: D-alanine--D-alanine ligase [Patescibacteria group bacterium]